MHDLPPLVRMGGHSIFTDVIIDFTCGPVTNLAGPYVFQKRKQDEKVGKRLFRSP